MGNVPVGRFAKAAENFHVGNFLSQSKKTKQERRGK
jgi:hypothetical protein